MIPRDQLAHRPASISTNQKWQLLVDEMQARWNADDLERAEELFHEFYEISFLLLLAIARAKAPTEMAEDVVAKAYLEFYEMLAAHKPIHNAKGLLGTQKDKNIQKSVIYSKPLRFGGKHGTDGRAEELVDRHGQATQRGCPPSIYRAYRQSTPLWRGKQSRTRIPLGSQAAPATHPRSRHRHHMSG